MAEKDISFSSLFNYQKLAFNTSQTESVGVGTTTVTISHNLGYIPSIRVWYDPALGRRIPITTWQITETNSVSVRAYLTTTTLVLTVNNTVSTKSVVFWYRIYYDS